jgi:hypothetical protein
MKCHTNVNRNPPPPAQLPQTFTYIVAIFIHNHFESPNITQYYQFNTKYNKFDHLIYGYSQILYLLQKV